MISHLLIKAMKSPFLFIVIICIACTAISLLIIWTLYLVSEQNKLWKQFVIVVSLVIFLIYVFNEAPDLTKKEKKQNK